MFKRLLPLFFILTFPLLAQEPKLTRDYVIKHERWQWLAGYGAILAGTGMAFYGASYAQDHGSAEQGWALGSHPSHARLVGVGTAAGATYSGLYTINYFYYRDSAKPKQRFFAKIVLPVALGILNGYYANNDLSHSYGVPKNGLSRSRR